MQDNDQRPNIKKDIWVIILLIIAITVFLFTDFGMSQGRVYDCRDAHWHPDYPIEVKEECRKLMNEEYEKQRQERNIIRT